MNTTTTNVILEAVKAVMDHPQVTLPTPAEQVSKIVATAKNVIIAAGTLFQSPGHESAVDYLTAVSNFTFESALMSSLPTLTGESIDADNAPSVTEEDITIGVYASQLVLSATKTFAPKELLENAFIRVATARRVGEVPELDELGWVLLNNFKDMMREYVAEVTEAADEAGEEAAIG